MHHSRLWRSHRPFSLRKIRRVLPRFSLPRSFFKHVFLIGGIVCLLGFLGGLGYVAYISKDLPDPNQLADRKIPQSSKIFDRTGTHLIHEFFQDENRTLAKLQQGFCHDDDAKLQTDPNGIPLVLLQATVSAEDRQFCSHHGFVFTSIVRAVLANLRGERQGGSTITQQLVKNTILNSKKEFNRKIKELILSIELERRYSKDEILQMYLNEIPYGSTFYGIQSASNNLFSVPVKDLTIAQAATLAAIPQSTTTYLNNPDLLLERRNWILDRMMEFGYITSEQHDTARAEETPIHIKRSSLLFAPHFVMKVQDMLNEQYGSQLVKEGGLRITTTLDYDMQTIAQEEVEKGVEAKGKQYQFNNAGLLALDPKTGQILAMVGSKDYHDATIDGNVNITESSLQPGSSFKPIVYTKAFEMGYTPNTMLWDVNTDFPTVTGTYTPANYDGKEHGPVSIRNALQGSLNIPAVKTLFLVGLDSVLDFAQKLGYSTFKDRSQFGPSIVLGGGGVKMTEHVNAYASFANDGIQYSLTSILKIEDSNGLVLYEWKPEEGKRVVDQNVARMTTDVLSDNAARVPVFGEHNLLHLADRPIAAKTGTTNKYKDAWTVGYTPSLAAGVWVGNTKGDVMKKGADGSVVAAPIWNGFFTRALKGKPVEAFQPPQIPLREKPVLDGVLPTTSVVIDTVSQKRATEYTPPSMRETKLFAEYHTILHYINREDPLGDAPADPTKDPYYASWEAGVVQYLQKKELETGVVYSTQKPPEEYDDVHTPSNQPTIQLLSPADQTDISDHTLTSQVQVSSPRRVARVQWYLDDLFLGVDTFFPYELHTSLPSSLTNGYHTLKAVAYDDAENSKSTSVGIRLSSASTESLLEFVDPKNGQTIERINEEYSVVASLKNPTNYRFIALYAQPLGAGDKSRVAVKLSPDSAFTPLTWPLPASGDWALSLIAEPKDAASPRLETAGIVLHIVPPASSMSATPDTLLLTTPPEQKNP